ncbi:MAG: penicillin-binding protein [Gaiellaceae bacterium]|nr:penicillin-binding protein [Gaiellaceae bacterium]
MLRLKRRASAARPRRGRIRKLRLLALVFVLGLLSLGAFTFGLVTAVAGQIPEYDPAHQKVEADSYIYDNQFDPRTGKGGRILAVLRGSQSRVIVPSDKIAPVMKLAIVAIEDRRFFEHRGVDIRGMARALWADVTNKKLVEGGSTITQQLVKNAVVGDQRTIARKLKEAAIAWQIEQKWKKDRILTAYLNTIYFGNSAYGIQRASETYFQHSAEKLTLPEAALLAGIPADPSLFDPVANPAQARARRALVLRDMLQLGDISQADFIRATKHPLPKPQNVHLPGTEGPAQYFVNYVKAQLSEHYGTGRTLAGGLRVQTSIDLKLQTLGRQAIAKTLANPDGPSAALVAMDPRSGAVLAMVGGNNYRKSQFNLAVQGERSPGSSFKPFVLTAALEQGVSPSTTLVSHPVVLYASGTWWAVHNYEDAYMGPVDLATATTHSDNSVFAQLTQLVGPPAVVTEAKRLGITSRLKPYFSIGLGAQAVNPLEMARAYSGFANGGQRIDGSVFGNQPRAIVAVRKPKSIDWNFIKARQVISANTAATVTSLLEGVVREGTGRAAALPDRTVAGKTGTTENYGDAWFVGYTPQLVTAVWVGYPNKTIPMLTEYKGGPVAGGTYPAEIWKTFMESALKALGPAGAPESFTSPTYVPTETKRVVRRDGILRLDNGVCRFAASVVYFSGRGPSKTARCKPNEVEVPNVVGSKLAAARQRVERQPLTPVVIYKPAAPLQRTDIVIAQYPRRGTLSSYDRVTLVMAKPLHGVVPRLIGLSLRDARARLKKIGAVGRVDQRTDGPSGKIVSQAPPPGVAATPRMSVRLAVARG